MRERLFELIVAEIPDDIPVDCLPDVDAIVDRLLAAGVIVPPCKVGDTVYHLTGEEVFDVLNCAEIYDGKVFSVSKDEDGLWLYCKYDNGLNYWYAERDIGKLLFLTREEAEKALAERREGDATT